MLEERLAQARAAFTAKLGERLDALARATGRASREGDGAALEEARQLAHKLAGSAGTFGLAALRAALAQVDRELRAAGEEGVTPAAAERIAAAIEQARAIARDPSPR